MKKENIENEENGGAALRVFEEKTPKARIEINPWDDIESISLVGNEHSRRELTVEELKKVCGYVKGDMRVLFAIGIYTGMRLADCVLLDWGEVDMVRRRISLVPRKTRKKSGLAVVIPIHPVLYSVLDETPEDKRRGAVVPDCAKAYLASNSNFSTRLQGVFTACGIKTTYREKEGAHARCDVGFHSLRHTFVSMAANAGASLDLVRKIVGHTSRAMTWHYFHTDEKALRDTVSQLPDVTGGMMPRLVCNSPTVEVVETVGEICGAPLSELAARVCEDVRRLNAAERVAVARCAFEGLGRDEMKRLEKELHKARETVCVECQ